MEIVGDTYRWLPLCAVIENQVFVVHGGLHQRLDLTLAEIEKYEEQCRMISLELN